jgi:SAM-dependent methyltransferase
LKNVAGLSTQNRSEIGTAPDSLMYNALAWSFGFITGNRSIRRWAVLRVQKDSRFAADELRWASLLPTHLLDAVVERWRPFSVLDIGCGTRQAVKYLAEKGIDCIGVEGSRAVVEASPVRDRIQCLNLNHPVSLGRLFDVVWSYEVAEHIHPAYTDAFLHTLTSHGPVVVLSAAQPGQGGYAILTNNLDNTGLSGSNAAVFRTSRMSPRISSHCQTDMHGT